LAVVLARPDKALEVQPASPVLRRSEKKARDKRLRIGVIGCGAFAQSNLLPHFQKLGARLYGVANRTSRSFPVIQVFHSPEILTTCAEALIDDENVDAFIVSTRHGLHARFAEAILRKGKPVHVEKPLALTMAESLSLAQEVRSTSGLLTIGFNRRFAPAIQAIRKVLSGMPRPRQFLYRINAPALPAGHWSLDPEEGGGRLVGEGCHFIDLLCHLAGSDAAEVSGGMLGSDSPLSRSHDNFSMTIRFSNGDLGTIFFSGQGNSALPKERLEVYVGGHAYLIDDFHSLQGYGAKVPPLDRKSDEKGFQGHLANFFEAVRGETDLVTTVDDWLRVVGIIETFTCGKTASA
jgi:predicted dehydrogenase